MVTWAFIDFIQKLNCKEIIENLAKVLKKHPGMYTDVVLLGNLRLCDYFIIGNT